MTACFAKLSLKKYQQIFYEDDQCIVIQDINPQATYHYLILPKKHIATTNDIQTEEADLIGHLIITAKNTAKKLGIDKSGYRLIFNCNADGGQEVYHIHCHLLGGEKLKPLN